MRALLRQRDRCAGLSRHPVDVGLGHFVHRRLVRRGGVPLVPGPGGGGALAWPSRPGRVVAAALIGSYVVGEQAMFWRKMLPTYWAGERPRGPGRIAELQPPLLGTVTCLLAWAAAGSLLIAAGVSMARLARTEPAGPVAPAYTAHMGSRRRSISVVASDSPRLN